MCWLSVCLFAIETTRTFTTTIVLWPIAFAFNFLSDFKILLFFLSQCFVAKDKTLQVRVTVLVAQTPAAFYCYLINSKWTNSSSTTSSNNRKSCIEKYNLKSFESMRIFRNLFAIIFNYISVSRVRGNLMLNNNNALLVLLSNLMCWFSFLVFFFFFLFLVSDKKA